MPGSRVTRRLTYRGVRIEKVEGEDWRGNGWRQKAGYVPFTTWFVIWSDEDIDAENFPLLRDAKKYIDDVLERCHVCGSRVGVHRPRPELPPSCSRDECLGATAGLFTVDDARGRLAARGVRLKLAAPS